MTVARVVPKVILGPASIVHREFFGNENPQIGGSRSPNLSFRDNPTTLRLLAQRLACRAKMRATLPDYDSRDLLAAYRTWQPFPPINSEVVLEITAAIDTIDTGAMGMNSGFQYLSDTFQ